jgi:hypothetical protein
MFNFPSPSSCSPSSRSASTSLRSLAPFLISPLKLSSFLSCFLPDINSIEKDSKGNFLIDSRHCHAAYYVSGETGEILWTLGGRNSSFAQGEGTAFYYQHDARWHANETQISIFDNAASTWEVNEDTARTFPLSDEPSLPTSFPSTDSTLFASSFFPLFSTLSSRPSLHFTFILLPNLIQVVSSSTLT